VEDAPELSSAVERNIEHLRPWMPWIASEPLNRGERERLIEGWEQTWLDRGDAVLGVFMQDRVIGSSGLHRRRGPQGLEIGYWIDKDYTNQGLATETARLLTTAALSVRGVTFVEIHHDKANASSRRVPEHLGYRVVGECRDEITAPGGIEYQWRMEAADWHDK
jgi:RimJ/RimL family protein N-acetyltransferase